MEDIKQNKGFVNGLVADVVAAIKNDRLSGKSIDLLLAAIEERIDTLQMKYGKDSTIWNES